jgi:hypothetical protein
MTQREVQIARLAFGASGPITIVLLVMGLGLSAFIIPLTMAFQVALMPPHQRRQVFARRT